MHGGTATKIQTIYQAGVPAFVVLPYEDFAREHPTEAAQLRPLHPRIPEGDAVPHEVVSKHIDQEISLPAGLAGISGPHPGRGGGKSRDNPSGIVANGKRR